MSKEYSARFRCSAGCGETYALDEVVYRCRNAASSSRCTTISTRFGREARQIGKNFSIRAWDHALALRSGVWGKKDSFARRSTTKHRVDVQGNTNLFWAKRFGGMLG